MKKGSVLDMLYERHTVKIFNPGFHFMDPYTEFYTTVRKE
jgi:hypothetical protein